MRKVHFCMVALAALSFLPNMGSAQDAPQRAERPGFEFGGHPKYHHAPLAKNEAEKRALAALDEMTKGQWYLNITSREGRVMRQLAEAMGAKQIVEIGTSSGYSTLWLALAARANGGKVITHEIDPEKVKIATANFKKAGLDGVITIVEGDLTLRAIGQNGVVFDHLFLSDE